MNKWVFMCDVTPDKDKTVDIELDDGVILKDTFVDSNFWGNLDGKKVSRWRYSDDGWLESEGDKTMNRLKQKMVDVRLNNGMELNNRQADTIIWSNTRNNRYDVKWYKLCTTIDPLKKNKSKYKKKFKGGEFEADVYDVLDAFETNNSAIDHAIKKLLAAGSRGVKDKVQDYKEAVQSIERAIEMEESKK